MWLTLTRLVSFEVAVTNKALNELNELVVDDETVELGELMVALLGCQCKT